jgi:two-component system OmpR family response regulator
MCRIVSILTYDNKSIQIQVPSNILLSDNRIMDTQNTVLIVDDDREIRSLLADYLETHGYTTLMAADGHAMSSALEKNPVDLLVLDLNLPGEDGLTLCRNLRAKSNLPVIMLTARGEPLDRILGLEMGADDYLPKPFEPRELLARIRSVLRRTQNNGGREHDESPKKLRFGEWTLDLVARHLISPDERVIALSGSEYRLLNIFLEQPNTVLNRDQLLNMTQGRDADPFDRSIDIQISRLRQKLGEDARSPQIIKTVRNGGYVLSVNVTAETH